MARRIIRDCQTIRCKASRAEGMYSPTKNRLVIRTMFITMRATTPTASPAGLASQARGIRDNAGGVDQDRGNGRALGDYAEGHPIVAQYGPDSLYLHPQQPQDLGCDNRVGGEEAVEPGHLHHSVSTRTGARLRSPRTPAVGSAVAGRPAAPRRWASLPASFSASAPQMRNLPPQLLICGLWYDAAATRGPRLLCQPWRPGPTESGRVSAGMAQPREVPAEGVSPSAPWSR